MESAKKEKITPESKPVGKVGGVASVSHSHLTTPQPKTNGENPWGKKAEGSIF